MGRLMAPMMRKQFPKQMNTALADMKQHLEARVIGHAKAAQRPFRAAGRFAVEASGRFG